VSHSPLAASADLQRLCDEGYEVVVVDDHLVLSHVPFLTKQGQVAYGQLISTLALVDDVTITPDTHVVYFAGGTPCDALTRQPLKIINGNGPIRLSQTLTADHSFSSKPDPTYTDYYAKMTAYVGMVIGHARVVDADATARTYPVLADACEDGVFRYADTASTRARIAAITAKLRQDRIAIVGLGGTGSYILDFLAKTPVRRIHLFDGDRFGQHNAFRAPGAPSGEDLRRKPFKVEYFYSIYDRMHTGIVPHAHYIDESTIDQLRGMSFVFLAMEGGDAKRKIVTTLEQWHVPFIDVGLGVERVGDSLMGILRLTISAEQQRNHVWERQRIPFGDDVDDQDDEYRQNIQIGELNALNAALAVIRWKKYLCFYVDLEHEFSSTYTIDGNIVVNDDQL
jgi:hypothetical protein